MKNFLNSLWNLNTQFVATILVVLFLAPSVLMSGIAIGVRLTCIISPHSTICGGR
jgi:hypothetical protein